MRCIVAGWRRIIGLIEFVFVGHVVLVRDLIDVHVRRAGKRPLLGPQTPLERSIRAAVSEHADDRDAPWRRGK